MRSLREHSSKRLVPRWTERALFVHPALIGRAVYLTGAAPVKEGEHAVRGRSRCTPGCDANFRENCCRKCCFKIKALKLFTLEPEVNRFGEFGPGESGFRSHGSR